MTLAEEMTIPDQPLHTLPPIYAVVVAGGKGVRMNASVRKQYLELAGMPILVHTLKRLSSFEKIHDIVLVVPGEDLIFCQKKIVSRYGFDRKVHLVDGGERRQDSVMKGLKTVRDLLAKCDHEKSDTMPHGIGNTPVDSESACIKKNAIVLIHDAVRPFADHALFERVLQGAMEHGAAIPGIPVVDTLKRKDAAGFIAERGTVDRTSLYQVQTPQGFDLTLLLAAYANAGKTGFQGTDDASLVEHFGKRVVMVKGARNNIKITTPGDLTLAAFLIADLKSGVGKKY